MTKQGDSNPKMVKMALCATFSSWYARVGLAGALAAGTGLVYWFRSEISSAYFAAQHGVLGTLGLGIVPVAIWLAVCAWALRSRRSWFRRVNLWVGSLVLVAFILGALSCFQVQGGALGAFTGDDGYLGGHVGYAIVGESAWQAVLALSALFVVAMGVAAPRLSLDLATGMGKLLVYAYIVLIVAAKATASALRHMYRFEPRSRFGERGQDDRRVVSPATGRDSTPEFRPRPTQVSETALEDVDATRAAALSESVAMARTWPSPTPVASETEPRPGIAPREPLDSDSGSDSGRGLETRRPLPAIGRFNRFWGRRSNDAEDQNGLQAVQDQEQAGGDRAVSGPILDVARASWDRPPMSAMADADMGGISEKEMAETAETIRRTLAEYGVEVEIGESKPGPTVTMYGLIPGWVRRYKQVKVADKNGMPKLDASGKPVATRVETKTRVKVDSIMSREKDLALALKTPSIRIETPVLGKSLVGIEVPNPSSTLVTLRRVMESSQFKKLCSTAELPVAFGKGSGGETVVADLTKMPHLLVAGATGSGKSVFINTIVSCLLMEKTPAELRLLLIDPKRVELTPYNGIPHLLTPVVVETDQVVGLLKGLIREMMDRYRRLEEVGSRNIQTYNKKALEKMPYVVVAVDELADLMLTASFEVEQVLCRLAQLGRATGIHLVVATQRPSVDVVTGLIKANFPSRVSFGVTSQIDSRTILDTAGAEKLLGKGDMLYLGVDAPRPERVQGVYISDQEVEALVRFWQTTPRGPLPEVSLHTVGDPESDGEYSNDDGVADARDVLMDKAIDLAQRHQKLSTSLLQRRLRIGYPRAARLMDQLEDEGIVGPSDGSKSRDVIIGSM